MDIYQENPLSLEKNVWDLLLLADPSEKMVEGYLETSQVFVAKDGNRMFGVYVLQKIDEETVELKNIAVVPMYQKQGLGKKLLRDALERVQEMGAKKIVVGTGNSSFEQLAFYQKMGFRIVGVRPDFFVEYAQEIYENDIRCLDLIILEKEL